MNRPPIDRFMENNNVKILSAREVKELVVKNRMKELNLGYAIVDRKGTYWLFDDFDDIMTMANEGCLMESIESLAVESIDEFDIEYEKRFPTNTTTTQSYDQFVKKNEEIRRWCDNWFGTHGG